MEALSIVTVLLEAIIGLVVLGAIPWAVKVTRELGEIRATLKAMSWQENAIDDLRHDVAGVNVRLARMGNGCAPEPLKKRNSNKTRIVGDVG